MTAIKRSLAEISHAPALELSKTERRRLAKQAKKGREKGITGEGSPGNGAAGKSLGNHGGHVGNDMANGSGEVKKKKAKGLKPKMTKEERRAKFTQRAYESRDRRSQAGPVAAKTRCLGCRAWGHVVAKCPDAKAHIGICFNCGSSKHALRACSKPKQEDGSLPHAKCFVCEEKGHISAHCKQNANGIYPKGGSCKGCGSRHHLSKNCPDNQRANKEETQNGDTNLTESTEDDKVEDANTVSRATRISTAKGSAPQEKSQSKRRLAEGVKASARGGTMTSAAVRSGGDDLEDDDYYEPEDMPGLFNHTMSNGADDIMPIRGGMGVFQTEQQKQKKTKKKAKIVVF